MKKQILFLSMFILALFSGINSSFGQKNVNALVWANPSCTGSEIRPAIGKEYTYSVGVTPGNGYTGGGTFTWKVTDNVDLLGVASTIPAGEFTNSGGISSSDIKITWNATSIGKTYYLVVSYAELNSTATCTINNVKVFEAQPRNSFWLDINASTDGTLVAALDGTTPFNVCAPNVLEAKITTTGDPATARVTYKFGETTLYAIIHSGGYTGNYSATLTVAGLKDGQTAALPTGWTAAGGNDAMGNGTYTKTLASVVDGSNIPVSLVITNNQFEGLTDTPVRFTIDGTFSDGAATPIIYRDLYDQTALITCVDQPDDADYVIETIKARPTVTPTNPTPFVIPNPALK